MRKSILIFGLISGLIASTLMAISMMICYKNEKFEGSMVLGYTIMILAFSLIFVAIKNYRDKYNNGFISYGKAFKIGILITLIASTCYVATWAVVYHNYMPDYLERYTNHALQDARDKGTTAPELKKMSAELADVRESYKNPVIFAAYTYMEIFPVGLLVTLITSAFLTKKKKVEPTS
jgi:hypothetical protein